MEAGFTREEGLALLLKYNQQPFHIQHGLTLEGVMRWFAVDQGFEQEQDFWGIAGLVHDVDFEMWPQEHCKKAYDLLKDAGATDELIHAVQCHGTGICVHVPPEHHMEKVMYAVDELTGLAGAAALMRPSKSVQDMEVKSLKKKFKDKAFAAGCSRDVITKGAEELGWDLDTLFSKTLDAMRSCEQQVFEELGKLTQA